MTKTTKTNAAKPVKLNDTQRRILALGIGEESKHDRLVPVLEAKKLKANVESLLTRGLLAAFRPDHEALVIETGGAERSFLVTNAGFTAMNTEVGPEHGDDPANKAAKAGVMGKSYHDLYMAQGGGCADPIDHAMKDAFLTLSRTVQTKKGERSEPALDTVAMAKWGREIGLWNDRWDALNPGMQRMNLTNRVRSAVRHGKEIKVRSASGDTKGKMVTLTVASRAA